MRSLLLAGIAAGPALAAPRTPHVFLDVALSPDGAHVASIEGDQAPGGGRPAALHVMVRDMAGQSREVALPCAAGPDCMPSDPAWSPDGRLVFVLRVPGGHAHELYETDAEASAPKRLLHLDGTLDSPRFAPDGTLAVLATSNAAKESGAVEAGAAITGDLAATPAERRIAILREGALRFASPDSLFVYDYDWLPDGSGFVGTAAPGDGDNNWWVAKLYRFDAAQGGAAVLFKPADPAMQLAQPRVSPDGKSVAFIGGIMSDFGSTGGDAYVLPLGGGAPVDLTQNWKASVTGLGWSCDGRTLDADLLQGADEKRVTLALAPQAGPAATLGSDQDRLSAGDRLVSASCKSHALAAVRQSFAAPPEIVVGDGQGWRALTHANDGLAAPIIARSLSWRSGNDAVQGWLLTGSGGENRPRIPMVTEIHGGPAAASRPRFVGVGLERSLLDHGYALFLPNPRGSFGQGEAFTRANVRGFGYGDLADILAGVDTATRSAAIDPTRLAVMGWSYGGYMTMFAVTQTNRFRAAFAGAGIANWQSYYGENGIDQWMIPYFGASVYDDPAVYARSAPITFIKRVRTPTFLAVGERDVECPAPQTLEFYHALLALGVPTDAVIYPGEGHGFRDPAHIDDLQRRVVAWFDEYLNK